MYMYIYIMYMYVYIYIYIYIIYSTFLNFQIFALATMLFSILFLHLGNILGPVYCLFSIDLIYFCFNNYSTFLIAFF